MKFVCGHYQLGLGSQYTSRCFCFFESMLGKCVDGSSVVVAISPSSYSFLLMVDEVVNK